MQNEIREKIKQSMIAKDSVALNVYRGILTAFTNELVAKGKTPQDTLSDPDCLAVVKRLAKQRKDSIEQYTKGGRPELAESESAELAIIEKLLPAQLGEEEVKKVAVAKKAELGITDKSKAGILMGAVIKELKGQADGAMVKSVVEQLFNS